MLNIQGYSFAPQFKGRTETKTSKENEISVNTAENKRCGKMVISDPIKQSIGRDIVFGSSRYALDKVEVKDPDAVFALEKMQKYLKMLPDGAKISKPVMVKFKDIPIGNNFYKSNLGFTVDKTNPERTKVTAKVFVNLDTWSLEDGYAGETLTCIFDKKGRMIQGDMIFTDSVTKTGNTYGRALHFNRGEKNRRVIEVDGILYQAAKGKNDNWQRIISTVPQNVNRYSEPREVEYYFSFSTSPLMEIFKSLTRKDTSILE